jgi:hypothetical protein
VTVFVAFYYDYADSRNMAAFATDREMVAWLEEQSADLLTNTEVEVWPSERTFPAKEFIERATESNG